MEKGDDNKKEIATRGRQRHTHPRYTRPARPSRREITCTAIRRSTAIRVCSTHCELTGSCNANRSSRKVTSKATQDTHPLEETQHGSGTLQPPKVALYTLVSTSGCGCKSLQRGQEGVELTKDATFTKDALYTCGSRSCCCTASTASSVAAAPRVSVVRVPDLLPLTVCERADRKWNAFVAVELYEDVAGALSKVVTGEAVVHLTAALLHAR